MAMVVTPSPAAAVGMPVGLVMAGRVALGWRHLQVVAVEPVVSSWVMAVKEAKGESVSPVMLVLRLLQASKD